MHEDLIAWDEDERKQCREEWERMVQSELDRQVNNGQLPDTVYAEYDAALAAVRELRKLRRKVEK